MSDEPFQDLLQEVIKSDERFQNLLQEASKGDPWSQLRVAGIFFYGSDSKRSGVSLPTPIKRNLEEAFKWVKLAAEQGKAFAQLNLADMFYMGHGVKKDFSESFKWLKLAAKGGDTRAQNNLGYYFENGIGVEVNLKEAKSWYQLSYKNGLKKAYEGINNVRKKEIKNEENYIVVKKVLKLLNQTSPTTKSSFVIKPKKFIDEKYKEAFDLTYKIANSSKPIWFSYILLASMYLNGVGVAKNLFEAFEWLDDAYQDLLSQTEANPLSSLSKFKDRIYNQVDRKIISRDNAVSKIIDCEKNYFPNIKCLHSIFSHLKKTKKTKNNTVELILRKSMLLCPEKSVQIEAYTNYENGKQVLFTQQRLSVPPIIAKSGPYYEKLEGEAEAAGFYESFYESTGGFGGMTDSERDMFED